MSQFNAQLSDNNSGFLGLKRCLVLCYVQYVMLCSVCYVQYVMLFSVAFSVYQKKLAGLTPGV